MRLCSELSYCEMQRTLRKHCRQQVTFDPGGHRQARINYLVVPLTSVLRAIQSLHFGLSKPNRWTD